MNTKSVTIVVAVIGAAATVGAAVVTNLDGSKSQPPAVQQTASGAGAVNVGRDAVFNNNYTKSATEESAQLLRECETQHGMKTASEKAQSDETIPANSAANPGNQEKYVEHTDFRACTWPRPRYADPDGYSEIKVRSDAGPGDSEASGTNTADRIVAPCRRLRVTYQYGSQGAYENLKPFTATADTVRTVDEGKLWTRASGGPDGALPFYPDAGEIVILRNDKYAIVGAECL